MYAFRKIILRVYIANQTHIFGEFRRNVISNIGTNKNIFLNRNVFEYQLREKLKRNTEFSGAFLKLIFSINIPNNRRNLKASTKSEIISRSQLK